MLCLLEVWSRTSLVHNNKWQAKVLKGQAEAGPQKPQQARRRVWKTGPGAKVLGRSTIWPQSTQNTALKYTRGQRGQRGQIQSSVGRRSAAGIVFPFTVPDCTLCPADIDECLDESACAGGQCLNTDGSYMCFCTHPMSLDPTSNSCVFIPEVVGKKLCLESIICHLKCCRRRHINEYIHIRVNY